MLVPDEAGESIYLTGGGDADREETEPLVQSEGGGDADEEETEPPAQSEADAGEEIHLDRPLVQSEADDGTIVISPAEEFLGPEYDVDNVSVKTGFAIATRLFEDTHFAEWSGLDAGTLLDIRMYHLRSFRPLSRRRSSTILTWSSPPPLRL